MRARFRLIVRDASGYATLEPNYYVSRYWTTGLGQSKRGELGDLSLASRRLTSFCSIDFFDAEVSGRTATRNNQTRQLITKLRWGLLGSESSHRYLSTAQPGLCFSLL